MRTYKQAEDAGKSVGFELVMSLDLANASVVAAPWCAMGPGGVEAAAVRVLGGGGASRAALVESTGT